MLDKARQEYETRLQQAIERIAHLQKEVEKYRCLAGIEKLTQAALSGKKLIQIFAYGNQNVKFTYKVSKGSDWSL